MKKTLSTILAIIMMFSLSIVAFAANCLPIELGKDYTVTLKDDVATYSFTAPEDGAYRISASIKFEKDSLGTALVDLTCNGYNVSTISLFYADMGDFEGLSYFFQLEDSDVFVAKKGTEYTVSVGIGYSDYDEDSIRFPKSTVTFRIEKEENLREIKIGESYTVNGEEYFIFKPTEDGYCDIWSHVCPSISVTDSDGNVFYGSIDINGYPSDIPFEYTAGENYVVFVESDYDDNGDYCDSVFHVVDAKTIHPDIIELEDITIVRSESEYIYPVILPLGSIYNCGDLEYSIENEKIATVESNPEYGEFIVYGKRIGKTTLTITEPVSGITREVEVKVISRTTAFFRSVFEFISNIFSFIFGR